VVDEGMALATRVHATEKGRDPRDYDLFAYGGAGPLHACAMARILGIRRVVVPAAAGVLAATGLQTAIPMVSLVQTRILLLSDWDDRLVGGIFGQLEARARQALEGFASDGLVIERAADVRFRGQGFEVGVALPEEVEPGDLIARFERRYETLYGSLPPAGAPEVVSWRLTASLLQAAHAPIVPRGWPASNGSPAAPAARQAWFDHGGWVDAAVHRHAELHPDQEIGGPAIVHQTESTIVIGPRDTARIDDFGNCWITIGE
jgi:N-methylhydantoinase A